MMYLRLSRTLASAIAAVAGFAIVCVVDMRLLPAPDLPSVVREKIARLSTEGDQYDAIFLGSSRIQDHVMPALFDDLMARGGMRMKSFNFGISSLHAPEDDYVLDLILAQPHARLRWVFVEADFFQTDVTTDQDGTLRGLYWHDFPRFALVCRRLSLATETGLKHRLLDAWVRLRDFQKHAWLFCERSAGTGRGAEILETRLLMKGPAPMDWSSLGKSGDGWVAAVPSSKDIAEKNSGRLGKFLKERTLNPPERDEADSASQGILASLLAKIVRAGAIPVIVIPPRIRQVYFYPEPALARQFPVIDLCSPTTYPELYREEFHVDRSHLNEKGAQLFTRALAGAFLESVQKR